MRPRILLIFIVFLSVHVQAQRVDWLKIRKYRTSVLSDSLKENSGLSFLNGKLYTINDSGNSSEIFELDPENGEITRKIETGLINKDWEAITADEEYFYIGDFGNNKGNREDLKIYRIRKDSVQDFREIPFQYPQQKEFLKKSHRNNWDAECLIFRDGFLHLFTKEWQSYQTTHYRLDPVKYEEIQHAEKLETYDLGYLATDAAYFKNHLYIIGYTKKLEVYLTIFQEDETGYFFSQKPKKYYLGNALSLGQIEGIEVDESGIFISGEAFHFKLFRKPPSFYFIPKDKLDFWELTRT